MDVCCRLSTISCTTGQTWSSMITWSSPAWFPAPSSALWVRKEGVPKQGLSHEIGTEITEYLPRTPLVELIGCMQCCGSGSGVFLTPGSWIRNRFQVDPESRIPDPKPQTHIFSDNFLGKKFYNSLKIGHNFFLQHFINKIIFNFVKFMATKKGMATNFFRPSLLLLFLDPGSRMGKNQDPG
jgi:hypothetical protein